MPLAEIRKQVRIQEATVKRYIQRLSETEAAIAQKELELAELRAYLGVDKHSVEQAKETAEEYKGCWATLEEEEVSKNKLNWKDIQIIQLAPEETVQEILHSIQEGTLVSPSKAISWAKSSPFHPTSRMPPRILGALAIAPERRLSFQQLLQRMLFALHGEDLLQAYLREMLKQGLIAIA
jgi:hypothetical protein